MDELMQAIVDDILEKDRVRIIAAIESGATWKSISLKFGVPISTLWSFSDRNLRRAPRSDDLFGGASVSAASADFARRLLRGCRR